MPSYRKHITKYCSRKCLGLGTRVQIEANCLVCNTEFHHISSRSNKAKYCSRKCYNIAQTKKGTRKGNCLICGREYLTSPSKLEARKYCSRKCKGQSQKNTLSEPSSSSNFRKFWLRRGMVLKCERCGYDEHKNILGIHHKDRNRNNNKRENLEVLCPNCHSLEHQKHISH